jgi:CheY-like chemotaxis protein
MQSGPISARGAPSTPQLRRIPAGRRQSLRQTPALSQNCSGLVQRTGPCCVSSQPTASHTLMVCRARMTKLLVVDDNKSLRRNVYFVFFSNAISLEVCGQAESGKKVIDKVADLKPDIVILDASLPHGLDGLEASCEMRRIAPSTKTSMFSLHDSAACAVQAAGADGYVSKVPGGSKLVEEIRRLL